MTTAAVMQPYFFPYAGYFRLLAAADVFVIYDCVQFPRRGYVHRCHVPGPLGTASWLTLPLAPCPRDVLIRDLSFAADGRREFDLRLNRLSWFKPARSAAANQLREVIQAPLGTVVDFLEEGLRCVAGLLDIKVRIVRSSSLAIDPALRGQGRVLAIVKAIGATSYVNAPGGRELYSRTAFDDARIGLNFLPPYEGPHRTLLFDLMTGDVTAIAENVRKSTVLLPA